ncbi:hypothetical protein DYB37_005625 [Aphanomyces astaci]|uniref:START domain-containing protein n=1 Tax=Aphanomyces astaci TaxID=112090 RepID=A0A3R7ED64_APHAT|nr:hypothetical protein DYB35_001808 [Aphanomyces astaci]RHZ12284.1 hypothetical protein DYB37_005625 [Aphanomyces astaci]
MLHLRRPTWTSTQRQQVRESATQALRQFIFDSQLLHNDGGSIEWTLDGSTDKDGLVQLYTGKTPFNVVVFANARRVRGTLAQAATLADQFPTSHHFDALESVAVASLDEDDLATDNHHHHVGVTWMAVKAAPSAKVRDACVLEVRDMFETGGAKGFASLVQSIDVCPEATGFVRMHIQHTGYTFTEVSPGLLDVVCSMHVDFRGTLPSWVARRYMKKRVAGMAAQLSVYIKQMQPAEATTTMLRNVVSGKQCAGCFHPFKAFESRKICTTCRDRVCKACLTTMFVKKVRQHKPVCIRCVMKEATTAQPIRRSSPDSSSSSTASTHHLLSALTHRRHSSTPSSSRSPTATPFYREAGWAAQNHSILVVDDANLDILEQHDGHECFRSADDGDVNKFLDLQFVRSGDGRLEQTHLARAEEVPTTDSSDDNDFDLASLRPTASSSLERSRMSLMSDSGAHSISSVVWTDAISNFHSNLRHFKQGMHH